MPKLSILIPVYNEKYTVAQLLEEVLAAPLPEGMEKEIIVVDDASTDGTSGLLDQLQRQYPQIQVYHQPRNRGKGAAIRLAVERATGDFAVIQDADLEYDPKEYSRLLKPLLMGQADVVYGSRFLPSEYKRVLFYWHSLANRVLTTLSNILTNLDLTDMETCFKMVRLDILKSIPIRSNRFGIEPELTAKFAKRRCRIYEVPISYQGRTYEEGKKITWKDGFTALFTLLRFWLVDDLYNEKYGHTILQSLADAHRFNRWMADVIRPWVGDVVLEIGAGLGNLSRKLMPRESYTVSDIDPLYLSYLSNTFARQNRVNVCRMDVEKEEDFAGHEGRYDTVICLNVIEHVKDDRRALANIHRALKPGGRACILVPQGARLFGSLDEVLGHYRRYSRDELAQRMTETGFDVEHVMDFNRVAVPGWYLNGRVLKRKHFGKVQLKLFDSTVWLWRRLDRFLPWQGVSVIAIGRKRSE